MRSCEPGAERTLHDGGRLDENRRLALACDLEPRLVPRYETSNIAFELTFVAIFRSVLCIHIHFCKRSSLLQYHIPTNKR